MIAPLDPTLTSSHPKFEALYRDLCTNKLNADATSRLDPKTQNEREALSEDVHKARVEAARKSLVRNGLQHLSYAPSELPEELQELLAVVAAVLDDQIAEEDKLLLQDVLMAFKRNTEPICAALSNIFTEDASTVSGMMDLDHCTDSRVLPKAVAEMKIAIAADISKTAEARLALTQEAAALHDVYRQIIEASIRTLEQSIHGAVARGTKAKADYLATVAEGMSKKLELQRSQLTAQLYSDNVQAALRAKAARLDKEGSLAKSNIREADGQLEEYKRASGIKTMAVEYAEIVWEIEKVRAEVERLQTGRT